MQSSHRIAGRPIEREPSARELLVNGQRKVKRLTIEMTNVVDKATTTTKTTTAETNTNTKTKTTTTTTTTTTKTTRENTTTTRPQPGVGERRSSTP